MNKCLYTVSQAPLKRAVDLNSSCAWNPAYAGHDDMIHCLCFSLLPLLLVWGFIFVSSSHVWYLLVACQHIIQYRPVITSSSLLIFFFAVLLLAEHGSFFPPRIL